MKSLVLACMFFPALLVSQEALEEVKRQAYGNPFNASNENFINMANQMEQGKVSLVLYDDWKPMEIMGVQQESYVIIDSANYHIMHDKVLFIKDGQYFELFPEKIDYIKLNGARFINTQYVDKKDNVSRTYFEVLEEGDMMLLRRYDMKREVRNEHPMGLAAAKEVSFDRKETLYYLRDTGRRPLEVPKKKKDFVMIFRRDRPEMIIYAKENGLSTKRVDDVRKIFAHYNVLAGGS